MERKLIDIIVPAIATLTAAFQDPKNANVCATRMRAASETIDTVLTFATHSSDAAAVTKVTRLCPELLRAGAKFATRKRSAAEHQALVKRLCTCRCDFTQPGMVDMHTIAIRRPQRQGDDTVPTVHFVLHALFSLGRMMSQVLSRLTQNKFYTKSNVNKAGQLLWPQDLTDLLPSGPEDAIDGLDLWVREVEGHIALSIPMAIARFYKPFTITLLRPSDYTFALVRPLQHLTAVTDRHDGSLSTQGDEDGEYFINGVWIILSFMGSLDEEREAWRTMLASPSGNALLKSALPVLEKLSTTIPTIPIHEFPGRGAAHARVKTMIAYAMGYFNERGFLDCTLVAAGNLGELCAACTGPRSNVHKFWASLSRIRDTRQGTCLNIDCPDVSQAAYSKLCSQCKLVRFCGDQVRAQFCSMAFPTK